jgi:hypothetical protein
MLIAYIETCSLPQVQFMNKLVLCKTEMFALQHSKVYKHNITFKAER